MQQIAPKDIVPPILEKLAIQVLYTAWTERVSNANDEINWILCRACRHCFGHRWPLAAAPPVADDLEAADGFFGEVVCEARSVLMRAHFFGNAALTRRIVRGDRDRKA